MRIGDEQTACLPEGPEFRRSAGGLDPAEHPGGERVNLDALNAEQQLYTTRRDLAQARYDYLMAWTKLHYYAGTLGPQDLAKVDEAFVSQASIQ